MYNRKELVILAEDWGGHPSSPQHLIKHMLDNWQTIWVNALPSRLPTLSYKDIKRAYHKLHLYLSKTANTSNFDDTQKIPLEIINPLVVPHPYNETITRFNQFIFNKQLLWSETFCNMHDPIYLFSYPTAYKLLPTKSKKLVYYCGDDYRDYPGFDSKKTAAIENKISQQAALIIVSSETLLSRFPSNKTILLEHGVDFQLFSSPQSRPDDLPKGKKIAGFFGSLDNWLDVELMYQVAQRLKQIEFVIIGKGDANISNLQALSNVHILGHKPYQSLPAYAQHWDVSLIPFKITPLISACNPLKFREYMAAGNPIVSTPIPALFNYRDKCYLAKDADEFCAAIEHAIKSPKSDSQSRIACAAQESWNTKATILENALLKLNQI